MKISILFLQVLILLALASCQPDSKDSNATDNSQPNTEQESPVKLIEVLVGDWQLEADGAAADAAPARLTFTEEARYIAYSGNQKIDSGAYRMNEQLQNLYLESEINEEPREYEMRVSADELTLKHRGPDATQAEASYTYRRVGSTSASAGESQ